MTGQELVKFRDSQVFRPTVMDAIINEFVPAQDQFMLTEAFLPFKLVDKDVLMDMINHGSFGRTNPVTLGGEHKSISVPGFSYKQHTSGHWRESVKFDEEVLLRAVNPAAPLERWGSGLASSALNFLDLRLNNLIEYITSKMLIDHKYSEARFGVNYTYDPQIPAKFKKDITASPGWTTGGTWATAANAKPTDDIIEAANAFRRYGYVVEEIIMSVKTLALYNNATDTQNKLKASYVLVGRNSDREFIFNTLTGLKVRVDNRLYSEEVRFTADSAVNDTTLVVENAAEFAASDIITLRNSLGQEEEATISSISGSTITISAGTTYAYKTGDRVTVYKQFLPDNYFIIKGRREDRTSPNNWISTPSLVKGSSWTKPLPGRYTWSYFNAKVPYWLEIGAGLDGGPKVSQCDWLTVKVA